MMKLLLHSASIMVPRSIKCIPRLNCIRKNNWRWPSNWRLWWPTRYHGTRCPIRSGIPSGTMAGNPLSMRAGIALLEVLEQNGVYERLDQLGKRLEDGLLELIDKHNITTINRVYGSLTLYFTDEKITHYEQVENSNGEAFAKFFKLMLNQGINLAPSKFEAWFLTTEHTEEDIDETLKALIMRLVK